MHPILHNRHALRVYLVAWIPIAAFVAALLTRGGALSWIESIVVAYPMALEFAFICLASWYLCRVTPLKESHLFRTVATFGLAAVMTTGLWLLTARLWVMLLDTLEIFPGLHDRYSGQTDGLTFTGILLFLLAAAVHYLMLTVEESRKVEQRALQLQILAREAELRALRSQIDPHFLFNSLNSISALTTEDSAGARRMCLLLADFLRRSLQLGAKEQITFGDELKLTESFLEIEKVRFGDRLSVKHDVDIDAYSCMVPPLLIQPLVENAIRHGVGPLIEGGVVHIAARRQGTRLEVVLENPYDEDAVRGEGAGVGLRNVQDRLVRMFGDQSLVHVERAHRRFRVTLRVPCVS